MEPVWLKRLGNEVAERRKKVNGKQEAFADSIRLSRQTMGIIEAGKRSYGIGPLLQVLAGIESDPVKSLVGMGRELNSLDGETIEACRIIVEAVNDDRRALAVALVKTLELAPGRTPRKGN